jgi:hypothetical protein
MAILLVAHVMISIVVAACVVQASPPQGPGTPAMSDVYGAMDWYRERPEPEQLFRGVLRTREAPVGPAGRAALRYELTTNAGSLAVYAPGDGSGLKSYVGRQVVVRAKLIDLSGEGFGPELWIASIGLIDAEPSITG